MWEAARAANVPYFEAIMEKLRGISQEAYDALNQIPRAKWTRCAFRQGTNCTQLVNNWAEAFNMAILKGRDQPIISMLNFIHYTVMNRLVKERKAKESMRPDVLPRVEALIKTRERLSRKYITTFCGRGKYSVTGGVHTFVVNRDRKKCTCGLWQLGGIRCVHAVCMYQSINKDPRKFVHKDYSKQTFLKVYDHFLAPIRGPMFWQKTHLPDIQPPEIRVLPGRPKRNRNVDAYEARERAEREAEENAKKAKLQATGVYKASRKGTFMHCGICGGAGHNKKTCETVNIGEGSSMEPLPDEEPTREGDPSTAAQPTQD